MDSRLVTKHRQGPIAVLPAAFFLFVLYIPLSSLFVKSAGSGLSDIPWDLVWSALRISALQAVASTLISGIVGITLAILYVDSGIRISKWFWNLSLVCFSLPTLIVSLSLISFWGRGSWFGGWLSDAFGFEFYGWFGVLCAHTFMNFAVFFRSISERLLFENRVLEKASLRLGASRFQTFRWVTWPKIAPVFRTSALIVFVYCFTSFLTVLLLGGGPKFTTLEVMIYQAVRLDNDLFLASVLSLLQLLFCTIAFQFIRKSVTQSKSGEHLDYPIYRCRTSASHLVWTVVLILLLSLLVGPLASLFVDGMGGLSSVLNAEVAEVTLRGLGLALAVGLASVLIGGTTSYLLAHIGSEKLRSFLKISSSLPLVLSSILLSMAVYQVYGSSSLFTESLLGPFLVQVLGSIPLVTRHITLGFERISPALLNSATSLGASTWQRFFWLELPLLGSTLRLAFVLSICLSLGEVGSLLMFAVGGEGVLPLWIFRQMGRYHFQEAAAGSVLLLVVLFIFFKLLSPKEAKT